MGVLTYNMQDIVQTIDGIILEGQGDGEVTVEYAEDAYSTQVGADGEVTRSRLNNESGTITFPAMHGKSANTLLASKHNATINGEPDTFRYSLREVTSGTTITGETCWIQGRAPGSYGRENTTTRDWVIAIKKIELDIRDLPES